MQFISFPNDQLYTIACCIRESTHHHAGSNAFWRFSGFVALFSSVQSVVSDSLRPHESQHARPPCPSPTPGVQTHVHQVSDAIQPSHPLSSPSPPAPNLSQHQGLFQWVNSLHEVAQVLEFQLYHQSSNEHPGLISFRMDWLDLIAVQGTPKSLLQYQSPKTSILPCSVGAIQSTKCKSVFKNSEILAFSPF